MEIDVTLVRVVVSEEDEVFDFGRYMKGKFDQRSNPRLDTI